MNEVAAVVARLRERGETVAVAESLTGGLLAAEFVSVPGSSKVFRGGLVVYATDLKHRLAGVDERLLADRGAVDPQVAIQLAKGARQRCGAHWGVATTGVAGPEPQDGQPVGLVYLAVAGPDGQVRVSELTLPGERSAIRQATVGAAVRMLAEQLQSAAVRMLAEQLPPAAERGDAEPDGSSTDHDSGAAPAGSAGAGTAAAYGGGRAPTCV